MVGRARLTSLRIRVGVKKVLSTGLLEEIQLFIDREAVLDDLYDFSYSAPGRAPHAATLQLAQRGQTPPRIFKASFIVDDSFEVTFDTVDRWLTEETPCRQK